MSDDDTPPVGQRINPRMRNLMRRINRRTGTLTSAPAIGLDSDFGDSRVILYFPDGPSRMYQLAMWLPVLATGPAHMRPVILMRSETAYREAVAMTDLTMVLLPRLDEVMQFYTRMQPEAILYVNNSNKNFQSLIFQSAAHIHINHGESDKISMVSNQAKAYDRVFVAGQAAIDRYNRAVAWLDNGKLLRIGRPQLDLVDGQAGPGRAGGPTLLYAPTWEGENEANNYTSINTIGVRIVEQLLTVPGATVWYKPHPRIVTSSTRSIATAHKEIVRLLRDAQHRTFLDEDVMPLLAASDYLVADVSSVTLDFLYLRSSQPLAIADRREDYAGLLEEAPVAAGAHVVNSGNVSSLGADVTAQLQRDSLGERREELVRYYFDGLHPGESSQRFFAALEATATDHTAAVRNLRVSAQQV
jgi:CDP-Glycerol:Poly(glycerophosphate) glycerophosphotransferase